MLIVFLIAQWTSFLNPQPIYDMVFQGDNIWAGTKGGLILFDKTKETFKQITNTDGLPSNQVVKTAIDRYGNLWLLCSGTNGGGVVVMTSDMSQKRQYSGMDGGLPSYNFLSLLIDGDSIWVSTDDEQLWLYDMNGNPFNNTQQGAQKSIQPCNQAIDIQKFGNKLWFSTKKGIGILDKSQGSFITYNATDGLPSDTVYTVTLWKDYMWAGTRKGIAKIHKDSIGKDSARWEKVDTNFIVRNFCSTDTALFFACLQGVFKCNFINTPSSHYLFIPPTRITYYESNVLHMDDNLWIGSAWNGIMKYNGTLQDYKSEGSATNYFVTLELDLDGNIWATHWGGEPGWSWPKVSRLYTEGNKWKWKLYEFPVPTTTNILVDKTNVKWVITANWNEPPLLAIAKIFPNDSISYIKFDAPPGVLSNMITASCFDKDGNLWVQSLDTYIRKYNTKTNKIDTSFSNPDYTYWASAMAVDNDMNLWLGSVAPSKCLVVFKNGSWQNLLSTEGINFINMEKQPSVWVGTTSGLYEFVNMEISRNYITSQLGGMPTDMALDPTGMWLGISKLSTTDRGGVVKLDNNGIISKSYTTVDGLVNDDVLGVEFDMERNVLWAGTKNGLSRFAIIPSDTDTTEQFKVTFYPNPFVTSKGHQEIVFQFDSTNGQVNIYTLSGNLITQKSNITETTVKWDTRDNSGALVPSGIYIFVAYPRNKKEQVGKFAIVR